MPYTVTKLAKLSGVSTRTLRFYDEIGLLKPAYYGNNNYRYYEEEQLLVLQQILFYRELDFSLNDIQRIVVSLDFNKIDALISHRKVLRKKLNRTQKLIKTIDKTIAHLREIEKMKDQELYYGFDSEKQKENEKYLVAEGIVTQKFLDECNEKVQTWSENEKIAFTQDLERIMKSLLIAIDQQLPPSSNDVQQLMREHYAWLERTWAPTKKSYNELVKIYKTPVFRSFFDERHPQLLEFMIDAMKIFAEDKLS